MGKFKPARASRAMCHALEPRRLLAASAVADHVGEALDAISAEYASLKSCRKTGTFNSAKPLVHIDDKRLAVEVAADDPAALKAALTSLRLRRASINGHL